MIEKEKTERIKAEQSLSGLIKTSSCNGELHGHLKAKTTVAETKRRQVELAIQHAQADNDYLKRIASLLHSPGYFYLTFSQAAAVEDDVTALRIHSANQRFSALSQLLPNTSFVEDAFVSLSFCFSSPSALIAALPLVSLLIPSPSFPIS